MKKITVLIITFLMMNNSNADGPAQPPAPAQPVLTLSQYQQNVQEESFSGCPSGSVLEGSGNRGRSQRAPGGGLQRGNLRRGQR